jgi:NAD(P)-dependent dehydrogenase (short-subunit alcohol dehydrogenase family)
MDSVEINGRVAIVTGAVRGIGLETARHLHQGGASVAMLGLERSAIEATVTEFGRLS